MLPTTVAKLLVKDSERQMKALVHFKIITLLIGFEDPLGVEAIQNMYFILNAKCQPQVHSLVSHTKQSMNKTWLCKFGICLELLSPDTSYLNCGTQR